jgi:hypothetical protein
MIYSNVGVYFDSDFVRYHLSQFKNFLPLRDCTTFVDVTVFKEYNCKYKIAVLQVPYPFDQNFTLTVLDLKNHCTHVFVIATEVHPEIVEFIQSTDYSNITYYICGKLNFETKQSTVKIYMDWFETSTYFYKKYLPEILTRLHPFDQKRKEFDILLGRKKLHRDHLYQLAKDRPGICVLTYFDEQGTVLNNDPEKWIWEHPGMQITKKPEWTVDNVSYFGHPMSLSQIIPIGIYNLAAYSVVAETCFSDHFAFYTEKTSKPIIAKRLFVMFAGKNYLSNLRKLGFRTFDGIIDESYDQEDDCVIRWQTAWEQMTWLARQPQQEILEKIRPIVEHNFTHIMNTNWAENFRTELEKDMTNLLN